MNAPRPTPPEAAHDANRFTIAGTLGSFRAAGHGLVALVRREVNARVHVVATLIVLAAGFALRVSRTDWCWLVVALALVWVAEALNTAIEELADEVSEAPRERLGRAKDIAAAGVLLASLAAVAIGALVLGPPLWQLLTRA
jgi:diacylglycerol kinase (ATP)